MKASYATVLVEGLRQVPSALALVTLCSGLALTTSATAAQSEAAASYPTRSMRIIVPFAAGGNIDLAARTIAPGLSEALGQPVVIDNRGGAGGRIGTVLAAKAPPDGYTLLLGADGSLVIHTIFSDNLEYDALRDFAYTAPISLVPGVIVVHPSLPVRNVRELIALAKAQPGTLLMASPGTGSASHLTGELFQSMAKVKFLHVPYKGGGASMVDLISGQVVLSFGPLSTPLAHVKAGRLRAVGVTTRSRSRHLPDVPTIDESGVPGFETSTLTVLALPAATHPEIVNKVRRALVSTLTHPRVQEAFDRTGGEVAKGSPEEYVRRMHVELEKWARIRKETGIRLQ